MVYIPISENNLHAYCHAASALIVLFAFLYSGYPPPPPPRGVEVHIRQTPVSLRVLLVYSLSEVFSCVSQSSLLRSQINVNNEKRNFYHSKVLRIASDVLNSSHRVRRRTFSNFLRRCRCREANLWRESSVVPQVERCRTLRLTASASCLHDFWSSCCCRESTVVNTSCFNCGRLCPSFPGKPFVAIKLVIVGTAVR